MLNAEKYKDEIQKILDRGYDATLNKKTKKVVACRETNCNHCAFFTIKSCVYEREKWLISEYKEPILTEEEKEYLSAVVKPFRKFVVYIEKIKYIDGWEKIIFYSLNLKSWECMTNLPPFQSGTRFKGMKLNKQYKLEELGL